VIVTGPRIFQSVNGKSSEAYYSVSAGQCTYFDLSFSYSATRAAQNTATQREEDWCQKSKEWNKLLWDIKGWLRGVQVMIVYIYGVKKVAELKTLRHFSIKYTFLLCFLLIASGSLLNLCETLEKNPGKNKPFYQRRMLWHSIYVFLKFS